MKRIRLMRRMVFAFTALMLVMPAIAKKKKGKPKTEEKILVTGNSLDLLTYWGEKTKEVHQVFSLIHNVLEADIDATYYDALTKPDVKTAVEAAGMTHLGGPMLGALSPEGAQVWVRTLRPAKVEVNVTVSGEVKTFGPVASTAASDLTAVVKVTGLKPSTTYPYRVLVDGKPIKIPEHSLLTTAPKELYQGKARIAFGTCTHRIGLGNEKLWTQIRSHKPAAMLLGGDIAVQDRNNHGGLHRSDYMLRDFLPAWKDFCAAVPVYASWDDHDYFNNDKAGIPGGYKLADKQRVCDVFYQAWNNPSYGFGDERRGVFFRTRIGPCDVIVLDTRYFRNGTKGTFLGDEQMKWLEKELLECKAPFKIISSGPMWSDYVSNGKDSWGKKDPEGRERIFRFIEKNRIGGVLLISGDRHGARGFRIPRPGGFNFYEFEAGSLGARSGPPVTQENWSTQLYGMSGKYAFGEFTFDSTLDDPEVTFRLIQDSGDVIYEVKLELSQLTPPAIEKTE